MGEIPSEAMALIAQLNALLERLLPAIEGLGLDGRAKAKAVLVGEWMMLAELRARAETEPVARPCPLCEQLAKRKQQREKTVLSAVGPMTYRRSEYRCANGHPHVPLDAELGLVDGSDCTLAMRELAAFVFPMEPLESASQTLSKLLGFR